MVVPPPAPVTRTTLPTNDKAIAVKTSLGAALNKERLEAKDAAATTRSSDGRTKFAWPQL